MIVSDKAIIKALTIIEANYHRAGWDNSQPTVYVLSGVGSQVYAGIPSSLPTGSAPGDVLSRIAASMWREPSLLPAGGISERGAAAFVGWAFVCEAWMADASGWTSEQLTEFDRGEATPLADRVGTVELRMVVCADTSGRVLTINRVRGKPPELNLGYGLDAATDEDAFTGRIPIAMRLMTLAACRHLPTDGHTFGTPGELEVRGDNLCERIEQHRTMKLPPDLPRNTRT